MLQPCAPLVWIVWGRLYTSGSTLWHNTKRAKSQVRGHKSRTAALTLHLRPGSIFREQTRDPELRGWEKTSGYGTLAVRPSRFKSTEHGYQLTFSHCSGLKR